MSDEQDIRLECEAAFEFLMRRYGERLTPEMVEGLRGSVETVVRTVAALRAVKLENGDAPLVGLPPPRRAG